MKRDSRGIPVSMVQQWSRPPVSCRPCREKKRRCDRNQPCTNCSLRHIKCEYDRQGQIGEAPGETGTIQIHTTTVGPSQLPAAPSTVLSGTKPEAVSLNAGDVLRRIRKLEEAVFSKPDTAVTSTSTSEVRSEHGMRHGSTYPTTNGTPFGFHTLSNSVKGHSQATTFESNLVAQLPPLGQARLLFEHFSLVLHRTLNILHLPSTSVLLEETYQTIVKGGKKPDAANILLLFSIYAGAALTWTPLILEQLHSTQEAAKAAFAAYTSLAMSMLENTHQPVEPSTTALASTITLAHVISQCEGLSSRVHLLRSRCLFMARLMQIDRLDSVKCSEERRVKGCNVIELEVQRRVWWHMVASDWLSAFSGGIQEGVYIFQPRHMNVNYPSNVDDAFITATGILCEQEPSAPTSMSAFIQRLKLAHLCREIVDTMPSVFLESREPDYNTILALDEKLQTYLKELPVFFKLDAHSIQESHRICEEQPCIALQRLGVHFSFHQRLCRLHRPYHLLGSTNAKYAYSRTTCVRSAHTILELRHSIDRMGSQAGFKAARSWIVMQHVFMAALTLAMDVSFNPGIPDAETHRIKVMAAYETLEKSQEESSGLTEGIQKNMKTLIATLQQRQTQVRNSQFEESAQARSESYEERVGLAITEGDETGRDNSTSTDSDIQRNGWLGEVMEGDLNLDQLWSEFLAAAPELDSSQWASLLDDMDLSFEPGVY